MRTIANHHCSKPSRSLEAVVGNTPHLFDSPPTNPWSRRRRRPFEVGCASSQFDSDTASQHRQSDSPFAPDTIFQRLRRIRDTQDFDNWVGKPRFRCLGSGIGCVDKTLARSVRFSRNRHRVRDAPMRDGPLLSPKSCQIAGLPRSCSCFPSPGNLEVRCSR